MQVIKPIVFNGLSFSRGSIASYYNDSGILVYAAIDELRFGYNPETLEFIGPIYEEEATNHLLYSGDFDNAAWNEVNSPLISLSSEAGPDGLVGEVFLFSESASPTTTSQNATGNGLFVHSLFVKYESVGGDGFCRFRLSVGGSSCDFTLNPGSETAVGDFGEIQYLQNGWLRVSTSFTTSGGVSAVIRSDSGGFYMSKPMLEIRPGYTPGDSRLPTSYYPSVDTNGIRAADMPSDPPAVASSNVPEDDYPVYDPGESYSFGDRVMVLGNYHRNYESLEPGSASNTGNFPPDSPTKWLDLGATNRWRVFDMEVGADLQASNEGSVQYLMSLDQPVNSVCLFNCEGVSATVRMIYNEEVIYEETISLISDISAATWWNYFFERRRFIKTIALTDLPLAIPSTIEVIIEGAEETDIVKLGKLVIGDAADLGFTEYGATAGITDYSTKEPDAFGNYYILERRFVDRADIKVVVDPGQESFVKDTLASVRATPAVFIGHMDYEPLIIYGFYKDFSILFSTPASSYCNLQLEGI